MFQTWMICVVILLCYFLYLHYHNLFYTRLEERFVSNIDRQGLSFVSILKPFEYTHPKLWREAHEKIQFMIKALKKSIWISNQNPSIYMNDGGRYIDIAEIYANEANIRYNAMRGFHECDRSIIEPDNDLKRLTDNHIQKAKQHWNQYCEKNINHTLSFQNTDGVQPYNYF